MPIAPENRARYPKDWKAIVERVRERSGDRCEGSPRWPDCRAANGEPHPETGSKVVLTTAHLDHVPENCDLANLRRNDRRRNVERAPVVVAHRDIRDDPLQALPCGNSRRRLHCAAEQSLDREAFADSGRQRPIAADAGVEADAELIGVAAKLSRSVVNPCEHVVRHKSGGTG